MELSHNWLKNVSWSISSFFFLALKTRGTFVEMKKGNTKLRSWRMALLYSLFYAILSMQCKCVPVVPFCILLCNFLMLWEIARNAHSANTLLVPLQRNLRKPRSHFMFAKLPSAWILRLIRSKIPCSLVIRSRHSFLCRSNSLDTSRVLIRLASSVFQWFPRIHWLFTGQSLQSLQR